MQYNLYLSVHIDKSFILHLLDYQEHVFEEYACAYVNPGVWNKREPAIESNK